jgi:exodeoxyribonuclease VII large subunit
MSQTSLFDLVPQRRVWTVTELTDEISSILEGRFPDVWIEGEVSNFRPAQSGHLYFTLKDSRTQIRCVCFRDQARLLKFRPDDGLQITLRGSLGVYEPRGEYQIYVSHIEPVGLGALQLAFEQLKKQLQAEGLFDQARKKPLPTLPRCIGVISSPSGAAIQDILRVLRRRFRNLHVQLYPVRVQGEGAARDIAAALRYFNHVNFADVLILARGGGSLEDLWAFNEETVARAIAESLIPVISGIGHETDFTIADFVADVRAPTPSAAAEIVVGSRQEFERHIAEYQRQLIHHTRYLLSERRHRVRDLESHHAFRQIELLVRRRRQQIDEISNSLAVGLRHRLAVSRQRLTRAATRISSFDLRARAAVLRRRIDEQSGALRTALERTITQRRYRFNTIHLRFAELDLRARVGKLRRFCEQLRAELTSRIDRLLVARRRRVESADLQLQERSPFELLKRGYSITYDALGRVVRSPDQVKLEGMISIRLARGLLGAVVKDKKTFDGT